MLTKKRRNALIVAAFLYVLIGGLLYWKAYKKAEKAGQNFSPEIQNRLLTISALWPYHLYKGDFS